jgi:hypothetical protein
LGVAVIGSVYASIYGNHLTTRLPRRLPHALASVAHSSVGAALGVAEQLTGAGQTALGGAVEHAASGAFIKGLSAGCLVAAIVAAVGAVAAATLLPAQPIALPEDAEKDALASLATPNAA